MIDYLGLMAENAALREALTDTLDILEDLRDGTGSIDRERVSGHIQVLRTTLEGHSQGTQQP